VLVKEHFEIGTDETGACARLVEGGGGNTFSQLPMSAAPSPPTNEITTMITEVFVAESAILTAVAREKP
jgi:hypothetical protein